MGQRLPRVLAGIALAGVAAASAACSSSSSPSASGTSPSAVTSAGVPTTPTPTTAKAANFNSCSVVTQSEAGSAIGQSVSSGVLGHATVEGGLACVFYGPSAPKPHTPDVAQPDSVRVVVVKGPNALKWYDAYRNSPQVHARSIAGFGDKAYYDGYASLSVLKGDYYLRVAVAPAGAPPSLPDEERLAAAILPRL